jgi:hypothetical protein
MREDIAAFLPPRSSRVSADLLPYSTSTRIASARTLCAMRSSEMHHACVNQASSARRGGLYSPNGLVIICRGFRSFRRGSFGGSRHLQAEYACSAGLCQNVEPKGELNQSDVAVLCMADMLRPLDCHAQLGDPEVTSARLDKVLRVRRTSALQCCACGGPTFPWCMSCTANYDARMRAVIRRYRSCGGQLPAFEFSRALTRHGGVRVGGLQHCACLGPTFAEAKASWFRGSGGSVFLEGAAKEAHVASEGFLLT